MKTICQVTGIEFQFQSTLTKSSGYYVHPELIAHTNNELGEQLYTWIENLSKVDLHQVAVVSRLLLINLLKEKGQDFGSVRLLPAAHLRFNQELGATETMKNAVDTLTLSANIGRIPFDYVEFKELHAGSELLKVVKYNLNVVGTNSKGISLLETNSLLIYLSDILDISLEDADDFMNLLMQFERSKKNSLNILHDIEFYRQLGRYTLTVLQMHEACIRRELYLAIDGMDRQLRHANNLLLKIIKEKQAAIQREKTPEPTAPVQAPILDLNIKVRNPND